MTNQSDASLPDSPSRLEWDRYLTDVDAQLHHLRDAPRADDDLTFQYSEVCALVQQWHASIEEAGGDSIFALLQTLVFDLEWLLTTYHANRGRLQILNAAGENSDSETVDPPLLHQSMMTKITADFAVCESLRSKHPLLDTETLSATAVEALHNIEKSWHGAPIMFKQFPGNPIRILLLACAEYVRCVAGDLFDIYGVADDEEELPHLIESDYPAVAESREPVSRHAVESIVFLHAVQSSLPFGIGLDDLALFRGAIRQYYIFWSAESGSAHPDTLLSDSGWRPASWFEAATNDAPTSIAITSGKLTKRAKKSKRPIRMRQNEAGVNEFRIAEVMAVYSEAQGHIIRALKSERI